MIPTESKRLVGYLVAAAPGNAFTPETVALYADQLIDLPYDTTSRVVRSLVGTMKFTPKPSEIREAVLVAMLGIPTVAAAVNEIAAARIGRYSVLEATEFSHPLVREAALEVGAERIGEDWGFSHREVEQTYARLRQEFLDAANVASQTGQAPYLPERLAFIGLGRDPYELPAPPLLAEGDRFSGWTWDSAAGEWSGTIESAAHRAGPPADDGKFPRTREGAGMLQRQYREWRNRPDVYVRAVSCPPLYRGGQPRLSRGFGQRCALTGGPMAIGSRLSDVVARVDAGLEAPKAARA